ncbi:MAG: glycosyltransferase family 1 protein [Bacteroidota bacterium]
MGIAFDAKRIFYNFTGLGNYSRTLVRELLSRQPQMTAYLMSPGVQERSETTDFLQNPSCEIIVPGPLRKPFWRSRGMIGDLKKIKPDLYHGLSNELPFGIDRSGIPSVVTIHDLIFRRFPDQYGRWDRAVYDRKFKYACEATTRIVAISEATKADIVSSYGIPPQKIEVIYQACDERFLIPFPSSGLPQVVSQLDLPNQYSLYLGSLIERKNLMGIIEAMALLPTELRHPLVVVGRGERYKKLCLQRADELQIDDLLLFRSVENEDLPALYQGARCFLYPSLAEGFGIPVIEALNSGTPVITSNISSLPEAAGPDSLLINPGDPTEIAEAWQRLLEDDALHKHLAKSGRSYAKRFRSEVVVPQIFDLYARLKVGDN